MKVTVAVLTYNEEKNIPDIMGSLENQTFPKNDFEILIIDNGSVDSTIEAVKPYALSMGNVRVINNPVKGIAPSRNVALKEAKYDYVAFTDADVIVEKDWLETLVKGMTALKESSEPVAAVGGGNVPVKDGGRFLEALGITLNSFWGSHGSTQGMLFDKITQVPHIPTLNIMYDKKTVQSLGGFDEDFRMVCEDPELNYRLVKAGYKIFYIPGAVVRHKMRPGLFSWLKNVFLYGRGRTQLLRKHPGHFGLMYLVPPSIVFALLSIPLAIYHPLFLMPLFYFVVPGFVAWWLCLKGDKPDVVEQAFAILALNPIAYGLGMIYGLFRKKT